MCKCSDSCNWCIACLVVVNTCDVDLPTIRGFANEDAIGTTCKSVGTLINKSIFRTTDILLADSVRHSQHGGITGINVRRQPCVEFDIEMTN